MLAILSLGIYLYTLIYVPIDQKDTPKTIIIPTGTRTYSIGLLLKEDGLINSPMVFFLYTKLAYFGRGLQAGRYDLNTRMSMDKIVATLRKGSKLGELELTIPEGYSLTQIKELMTNNKLPHLDHFDEAVSNPVLLERYGITRKNLEGYLFPDTYFISYNTTPEKLVEMMLKRFEEKVRPIYNESSTQHGFTLDQAIIMAAIIQKESGLEEMPKVASVFHNRIKRKMPLQSEATIRYLLDNPTRIIRMDDLKIDSPYNSYLHQGLPEGPICNPGTDAIKAALNPAKTNYLFFMANTNGISHTFSETFAQHLRLVAQYKQKTTLNNLNNSKSTSTE